MKDSKETIDLYHKNAMDDFRKAISLDPKNENILKHLILEYIKYSKTEVNLSALINNILLYTKELEFDSAQISFWFGSVAEDIVKKIQNNNSSDSFRTILAKHKKFDENNEQLYRAYQNVYLKANNVVCHLKIDTEKDYGVAHYTRKSSAEQMLFKDSEIRQCSIKNTNDKTEGKTLFAYLTDNAFELDQQPHHPKEYNETESFDYQAFVTCFTFNHNHLNQFRLYGSENREEEKYRKEYGKECTGLSLVFKGDFFAKQEFLVSADITNATDKNMRPTLYRCVYIDPKTHNIISVGQREEYTFYNKRQYNNEEKATYEVYKNDIIYPAIENTKNAFNELEKAIEDIKNKDWALIFELLINLRYLVKHYSFKEEQECRIIRVVRTDNSAVKPSKETRKEKDKLYIEAGKISDHIKKIYFGPCATEIADYREKCKNLNLNIVCEESGLPFVNPQNH